MCRLLDRNLRHTGQLVTLLCEGRRIADDEHLRMTGNRQIRLHEHTSRAIERRAERPDERRRGHARCPEHGSGIEPL